MDVAYRISLVIKRTTRLWCSVESQHIPIGDNMKVTITFETDSRRILDDKHATEIFADDLKDGLGNNLTTEEISTVEITFNE